MNCLIVDDNKIELTALKQLVSMDSSLRLVGECSDAATAAREMVNSSVDLMFLDIEMPEMSGIELVKSLSGTRPIIIFTTSGSEYAAEAYDLNVVDFITKPVSPVRFLQAVTKARELKKMRSFALESRGDEFIFIRDSNIVRRLKLIDIFYFEAMGDYVKVCLDGQEYIIHSTLKAVEQKLVGNDFFRVHRSFIINVGRIDTIDGGMIIMNNILIPVSDAFRAALNKRMQIL
ncbi:LytR/AlgR family response regulator transcription factor [Pedobacter sp. PWIIR3]